MFINNYCHKTAKKTRRIMWPCIVSSLDRSDSDTSATSTRRGDDRSVPGYTTLLSLLFSLRVFARKVWRHKIV